jgi:nucleoid-associated protein YgaU
MIMDPAIKIAMGLCVLFGGFCAAMLFRGETSQATLPSRTPAKQARIPARVAPPQTPPAAPAAAKSPAPTPSRPAVVVKPLPPPPPLAPKYPGNDVPAPRRNGSMEMMLPFAQTASTHRIVDGDTLEGLAQLYLGSPARAREIFDANRDVLSDPRLLPIGVELKIPRTGSVPSK